MTARAATPLAETTSRQRLRRLLRRIRSMLRSPRQIRPTRAGLGFLLLTLAVGFAALNTGNNLLYLVLGMMLSLIGVSGILSELSIRRLRLRRWLPSEIVVGQQVEVGLELYNGKRWLPAFGIWVMEASPRYLEPDPAFFVWVAADQRTRMAAHYRFLRRGEHRLKRLEVGTTYPFGLFRRSFQRKVPDTVLVYPLVQEVAPRGELRGGALGDAPLRRKGQGDDFHGLREYASGDDPRHIHWKTSAHRGRLLTQEFAAQQRQRLLVRLELVHPLPVEERYEEGMVQLVSYAAHYLAQGFQVAVELPGCALPFDVGSSHRRRILRAAAAAPLAAEAAELSPPTVTWPPCASIVVRCGIAVSVEESL